MRSILENVMIDIMYDLPGRTDIEKCIITQGVVEGTSEAELVSKKKPRRKSAS